MKKGFTNEKICSIMQEDYTRKSRGCENSKWIFAPSFHLLCRLRKRQKAHPLISPLQNRKEMIYGQRSENLNKLPKKLCSCSKGSGPL